MDEWIKGILYAWSCINNGTCSEKCVIGQFHCVLIIEFTYTDFAGITLSTPQLYDIAHCLTIAHAIVLYQSICYLAQTVF